MRGVFEVSISVSAARATDDLLLIVECSFDDEWRRQISSHWSSWARIRSQQSAAGARFRAMSPRSS
jgi:hypothetical protein